jgi:hypothetical protein
MRCRAGGGRPCRVALGRAVSRRGRRAVSRRGRRAGPCRAGAVGASRRARGQVAASLTSQPPRDRDGLAGTNPAIRAQEAVKSSRSQRGIAFGVRYAGLQMRPGERPGPVCLLTAAMGPTTGLTVIGKRANGPPQARLRGRGRRRAADTGGRREAMPAGLGGRESRSGFHTFEATVNHTGAGLL